MIPLVDKLNKSVLLNIFNVLSTYHECDIIDLNICIYLMKAETISRLIEGQKLICYDFYHWLIASVVKTKMFWFQLLQCEDMLFFICFILLTDTVTSDCWSDKVRHVKTFQRLNYEVI